MDGSADLAAISWMTWGTILWFGAALLAAGAIPSMLRLRQGRPLAAIAWLFALVGLPYIGVIAWWAIGHRRFVRFRRRRSAAKQAMDRSMAELGDKVLHGAPAVDSPLVPLRRLPDDFAGDVFPVTTDNQVDVLVDASRFYPTLTEAVKAARHHVHFLFYLWEADETGRRFRDLLAEQARRGIEVRVLVDAIGGAYVRGAFMKPLEAAGARVASFLPLKLLARRLTLNFRNHRKIVVIDGKVGFISGLNIGDEYTEGWHDIGVRLEGPVVDQLQEVFAEDWYFATGENLAEPAYFGADHAVDETVGQGRIARCNVIASGPDTRHNATHSTFFTAITQAQERVWIMTPYFIPDQAIQTALRTASYRGVDVQLIVPHRSDVRLVDLAARSYYRELLAAGIGIYRYQDAVLHSKVMIVDRDLVIIGSANLDIRSLVLNFEANCLIHGPDINGELAALFEGDKAHSRPLLPGELDHRSGWQEIKEAVAHLLSPLL